MTTHGADEMVLLTAKQLASGLIRAMVAAHRMSSREVQDMRVHPAMLHFHDDSTTGVAWNDVDAIQKYNAVAGDSLPVPVMATEGYNQHGHTSDYDGGWIPGLGGPHDHRDLYNGGFCFSCYHPGTSLPQQPWAL